MLVSLCDRIGGALLDISACSRTEHWLPLMGPHGEPLEGRKGKPVMLHAYVTYLAAGSGRWGDVPEGNGLTPQHAAAAANGHSSAHAQVPYPVPSRPSDTHPVAAAEVGGARFAGELVTRSNCRIGEQLWVIEDAAEVQRLTGEAAGISWNDDMADCCGAKGQVVAVLDKYVGMRSGSPRHTHKCRREDLHTRTAHAGCARPLCAACTCALSCLLNASLHASPHAGRARP